MKVSTLRILNLKGFEDTGEVKLSPTINVLIGCNNAGKSTIIRALNLLQPQFPTFSQEYVRKNIRKGSSRLIVEINFDELDSRLIPELRDNKIPIKASVEIRHNSGTNYYRMILNSVNPSTGGLPINPIQNKEPNNFIYPYLSRRKTSEFTEVIKLENTVSVKENFQDLYAKIDRIANPNYPRYKEYDKACKDILGFTVSCSPSDKGKQAGIIVNDMDYIPIDEMGEGTTNVLGLIVDMCIANNKLFLIEELENDLHPKALKAILDLIIEKSETNQFVISTHSNIVLKYLGAAKNSKLFRVQMELKDMMPYSSIKEISNNPQERIKTLEDLGYDLYDFEFWKAYLILEESSAERIIKDFLIPSFTPTLENKLKTVAAQGVSDLEARFSDFLRLFVFIHSTGLYHDRAWIVADGDEVGIKTIADLKEKFKTWQPEHFTNFSKPNFEEYYPTRWEEEVKQAFAIQNRSDKFKAKGKLVEKVIAWARDNKEEAIKEFEKSAAEIIEYLKKLEVALQ